MAQFIAEHGDGIKPSDEAKEADSFFFWKGAEEMNKSKTTNRFREPFERLKLSYIKKMVASCEKSLFDCFMRAVETHDRASIIRLADAIWFFKGKYGRDFVPADRLRSQLLLLISELDAFGYKYIAITAVVEWLKKRGVTEVGNPEDGYSRLRKNCKALGITIMKSRPGRKKTKLM